jgi:hypothetical protein
MSFSWRTICPAKPQSVKQSSAQAAAGSKAIAAADDATALLNPAIRSLSEVWRN